VYIEGEADNTQDGGHVVVRQCTSYLHFARAPRQAKQGHMGSIRTRSKGRREAGLRARWEMELDLFDGLTEEIAAFFLLPKRAVGWRSPCVNSIGSSRSSSLVGVTFPTRILPWLHAWPKRATARACLWCWVMWGAVRGQSKRGPGCVRVCVARPLLHDSSCLSAIKGA